MWPSPRKGEGTSPSFNLAARDRENGLAPTHHVEFGIW